MYTGVQGCEHTGFYIVVLLDGLVGFVARYRFLSLTEFCRNEFLS